LRTCCPGRRSGLLTGHAHTYTYAYANTYASLLKNSHFIGDMRNYRGPVQPDTIDLGTGDRRMTVAWLTIINNFSTASGQLDIRPEVANGGI
jgi:hypothetical protein